LKGTVEIYGQFLHQTSRAKGEGSQEKAEWREGKMGEKKRKRFNVKRF